MRRKRGFVPIVLLTVFLLAGFEWEGNETIYLVRDGTKSIPLPQSVTSVSVENPKIVDVNVDENTLLLTGLEAGRTKVIVEDSTAVKPKTYEVVVWEQDIDLVADRLRQVLKGLGLAKKIKFKVDKEQGVIYLSGTVYDEDEMKLVEQAITSCGSDVIINLVKKDYAKDSIRLKLNVMEVATNLARGLGITWPQEVGFTAPGGNEIDTSGNGMTFRDTIRFNIWERTDVTLLVRALEQQNKGRVLAHPNILALNGEEAEIVVGGEVPIITYKEGDPTVEFKPYGVVLKMTPTIIRNGIELKVECEVSAIDEATSTNVSIATDTTTTVYRVPGFKVRRAKTILTIKDGQTLVLGGLIKKSDVKDVSQIPGLANLPILGEFFKSRERKKEDMELVITISPEIVPLSPKKRPKVSPKVVSSQSRKEEVVPAVKPIVSLSDYAKVVQEKVRKAIRNFDARGKKGRVVVSIKIDSKGNIASIRIKESSNDKVTDRLAVNFLRDLQPFPPLPKGAGVDTLWLDIPIIFK